MRRPGQQARKFAPRERRGQLSIIQQWMITVGILVSYLVAVVVLLTLPNNAGNLDWRLFLGVGAIPAILALALRSKMPESPRWLMLHERYADARQAFARFGTEASDEEIRAAAEQLRDRQIQQQRKTQWTRDRADLREGGRGQQGARLALALRRQP